MTVVVPVAPATASDPSQWPASADVDPDLTATAHSIRFAGDDRYQTNAATALALRGAGSYPFDSPDSTDGGTTDLADASHWWGAASCPRSLILVAGDSAADALVAAELSDPTNQSEEPRLERVAAEDPLFDPIGGFDRVDTEDAPIVLTTPARAGATALAATARLTAVDLHAGGCTTAREAIIVGGTGAVAPEVATELVRLGYQEVFRVAGADRFETAARVAEALGTGDGVPVTTPCDDPDASDGTAAVGTYGNGVAEFRFSASSCRLLPHAVVLADGGTGADALAAGWWTSWWQIPVLLTAPDGSLPQATRDALATLDIDNLIVLGGTGRIPESTVEEAGRLATASVGRIAGEDRYATSVEMAKAFGGWFPSTPDSFAGSIVCLAASSGSGASSTGWPDALGAGPLCARLGAAGTRPPRRALPPVDAGLREVGGPGSPPAAHAAVPVLLVPTGTDALPASVARLLTDAFDPVGAWCTSRSVGSCIEPGFVVTLGGEAAVTGPALEAAESFASGLRDVDAADRAPAFAPPAYTRLDLAPVFADDESPSGRVCWARAAIAAARWVWTSPVASERPVSFVDLLANGLYLRDGDGTARSPRSSAPLCIGAAGSDPVVVHATSLSGSTASTSVLSLAGSRYLDLDQTVTQAATPGDGESTADGPDEAGSSVTWRASSDVDASLVLGGNHLAVDSADLDVHITRGEGTTDPDLVTVQGELTTELGTVVLSVAGEAVYSAGTWSVRGVTTFRTPGGGLTGRGGFTAEVGGSAVAWRFDGLTS